jgi:hypothetical protein
VAEHGGIWQNVATHVAERGGTWRHVAECGGMWQNVAEHGGIWQNVTGLGGVWQNLAEHGGILFLKEALSPAESKGGIRTRTHICMQLTNVELPTDHNKPQLRRISILSGAW